MTEGVTWEEITGAILFLIAVAGAIGGVWWRVEGKINDAKTEAIKHAGDDIEQNRMDIVAAKTAAKVAADQLNDYKLHVAETYATKAGLKESLDRVEHSINNLASRIDKLLERASREGQ